jgi:predicted AAA+ superfamily ATPase
MDISELLELNERAREDGKRFPRARELFNQVRSELGKHFIGIVGPRGVGKTVLLKQVAFSDLNPFIFLPILCRNRVFSRWPEFSRSNIRLNSY